MTRDAMLFSFVPNRAHRSSRERENVEPHLKGRSTPMSARDTDTKVSYIFFSEEALKNRNVKKNRIFDFLDTAIGIKNFYLILFRIGMQENNEIQFTFAQNR